MSTSEKIYTKLPNWAQSAAVYLYGYKLYRKRYTGVYEDLLSEVRNSEHWSKKNIYNYQCEKLQNILKYCDQNIPYYHRLFIDYGFSVGNATEFEDLKKLPVLTKQELRKSPKSFRAKNSNIIYATQLTSGSTGTPVTLDVDEETYKLAMALLVNFEEKNGIKFGDRRATFAGRLIKSTNKMSPPFWKLNKAENQLLFSSYHINSETFKHYRKKLDDFRPKEIIGYPSSIYEIAFHYFLTKTRPNFQLKLIVTNSENLLEWQKELIENVFECPVRDYYSTAEYLNFASQDTYGHYRSNPLPGITELEPISNNDGQYKLIMTTLTNRAMPLIRYDVGDLATPLDPELEVTGAPDFVEIEGRIDEYLETIDGRKIGRVSQIFKGIPGIKESQIIQTEPGKATFNIVSEIAPNATAESLISENAEARLGRNFEITIKYRESIPKQKNGKFRFVIKN